MRKYENYASCKKRERANMELISLMKDIHNFLGFFRRTKTKIITREASNMG